MEELSYILLLVKWNRLLGVYRGFKYIVFIFCETKNQEPLLACNYRKIDCMMSQLLSLLNLHFYSIWIHEILFQKWRQAF